jgi:hypothetical protein
MALQIPSPPVAAADSAQATLKAFGDQQLFSTPALRQAPADQLTLTTPHQIFTMGLDSLAAGAGLDTARSVGWRYLIVAGGQVIASAETVTTPDGLGQTFAQFTEGPFVAVTATAITAAQALPAVGLGSFELRLLRIPALYVMALWLHTPTAVGDLLLPLAPTPIGTAGVPSPVSELVPVLSSQARAAIASRPAGADTHAP